MSDLTMSCGHVLWNPFSSNVFDFLILQRHYLSQPSMSRLWRKAGVPVHAEFSLTTLMPLIFSRRIFPSLLQRKFYWNRSPIPVRLFFFSQILFRFYVARAEELDLPFNSTNAFQCLCAEVPFLGALLSSPWSFSPMSVFSLWRVRYGNRMDPRRSFELPVE